MKKFIFIVLWFMIMSLHSQTYMSGRFEDMHNRITDTKYFDEHDKMFKDRLLKASGDDWYEPSLIMIYPILPGVTDPSERYSYTYDSIGRTLIFHIQKWIDEKWISSDKLTYSYDSEKSMIILYETFWEGVWYVYRDVYTYSPDGNLLSYIREGKSGNQWIGRERTTWTYDESGNMLMELEESNFTGRWKNESRYSYEYDESGNMIAELYQEFSSNAWKDRYSYTYTYNEYGELQTSFKDEFLANKTVLCTYTYDSHGRVEVILIENYYKVSQSLYINREIYSYDELSGLLRSISLELKEGEVWTTANRYRYNYDESGNILTGIYESRRPSQEDLIVGCEMKWEYDNNGNAIYAKSESVGYYPKKIRNVLYYNNMQSSKSEFGSNKRLEVSYVKIGDPTSIEEMAMRGINIDVFGRDKEIKILINEEVNAYYEIIDIAGRVISKGVFSKSIDVSVDRSGLYIVRIVDGNDVLISKKVIVR